MVNIFQLLQEEPIIAFAILLAVILTVPILFERLGLPGLVGLLIAGVIFGPHGLRVLQSESETMKLLSDTGLLYLMFVAGLEIDLEQFNKVKFRSAGFGSFTYFLPLITGILIGRLFGFEWVAAVLIGSLLASHSLLTYPIVSRLGVVGNEAVTVTLGATIFTDIGALILLAICIGVGEGDFSIGKLLILLVSLAIYAVVILFGFNWLGQEFFRRSGGNQGNQFLFVLLVVFLSALGAELIGVEKIVGAFLAGFAVNEVIGDGPVKEKTVFVGSVLFIPIFFVNIGTLIDVSAFFTSLASIWLSVVIVTGLLVSKFSAAFLAKLVYRYNWRQMFTMWSMSIPQVATTLAAALVGNEAGLLSEEVLNSVIVMMLVTAILGPLVATRAASGLSAPDSFEPETTASDWQPQSTADSFSIVVPVYNPQTEKNLIELAALLAKHESGRIVPLAITLARGEMESTRLAGALQQSERLIQKATALSQAFDVEAEPLLRIDDSVSQGIARASREQKANLVIMGWSKRTGFRARLFGNLIDEVLWASHCPVAVTRLLESPTQLRRILVPVDNLSEQAARKVRFAQILAEANQAQVTVLNICDRRTSTNRQAWMKSQLSLLLSKWAPGNQFEIEITASSNISRAILQHAKQVDLVVMRSRRRRTAGGLAISDVTTQVVQQLACSVVMLGEPHQGS